MEEKQVRYLYKYRSLFNDKDDTLNEYTLDLLKNGILHFSSPCDFNDPFDSLINLESKYHKINKTEDSNSFVENNLKKKIGCSTLGDFCSRYNTVGDFANECIFNQTKSTSINDLRIFCVSSDYENILMWSHYADSHKGICIGFEFPKNNDNGNVLQIDNQSYSFKPMNYLGEFKDDIAKNLSAALFIKKSDWKYEKEYRVLLDNKIVPSPDKNLKIDVRYIKRIIFGVLTPIKLIQKIIQELFDSPNQERLINGDLELYQMTRDLGIYTIKIKEINYRNFNKRSKRMALEKPYYRCYRPMLKNNDVTYIRDSRNISNPYDYIRKIEILYARLAKIFEYVEPADVNGSTYSMQMSSLLLDICTTIEANFKDIFRYNGFNETHTTMRDYFMIEKSHHLSSYKIKIPFWKGAKNIRIPFGAWNSTKYVSLSWYQSYNTVKHNMITNFNEATLNNLVDSFCALLIISAAQFYNEDFVIPNDFEEDCFYGFKNPNDYQKTIRAPFGIQFPEDWTEDEKYSFDWNKIKNDETSFFQYPYKN